MSQQNYTRSC